jgi:para-nitrobenzyl esterase
MRSGRLARAAVALGFATLGSALCPVPRATATTPGAHALVRTESGSISGKSAREFLGIPYAAPPVGALRWRAPQPHTAWAGVRPATSFGDSCVQGAGWDPGYETPKLTEDCLYLNVYRPDPAPRGLPVMVWIHGGGFTGGAGRDVVPTEFARKGGVIAVTVNYRLGAMGFLAHPALGADAGDYGLMDQQAALRWVQRNIARFGGDPAKVTIAGESAGGQSVCDQMASPAARGLFRGAVIESGSYGDCAGTTRSDADRTGTAFAQALGCTDTACLRGKSAEEILNTQGRFSWGPVTGGSVLPIRPTDAFTSGRYNRVPVINGANHDEGRLFVFGAYDASGHPLTAEQYPVALRNAYGDAADQVLARYPLSDYPSPSLALSAVQTDQVMSCPVLDINALVRRHSPVYTYEFADETSPPFESLRNLHTDFPFGATHVNELQYLFLHFGHPSPLNRPQRELSNQMIKYWTTFVRTGRPVVPGLPPMPRYDDATKRVLSLKTHGNAISGDFDAFHKCAFWRGTSG